MQTYEEATAGNLTEDDRKPWCPQMKEFLSEGVCEDHGNVNELRCMKCKVWICSMCGFLYHKGHRTLLVQEALSEMKKGWHEKVDKELTSRRRKCNVIDNNLMNLNEKREKLKKQLQECEEKVEKLEQEKAEEKEICSKLEQLKKSASESGSYKELTKALVKLETFIVEANEAERGAIEDRSIQDVKDLSATGTLRILSHSGRTPMYARAVVEKDEVWIMSFEVQPTICNKIFTLEEISGLQNLNIPPEPHTNRAYLKLAVSQKLFPIVIRTDSLDARALYFLYLCSGIKGNSFKGTNLRHYALGYNASVTFRHPYVSAMKDGCRSAVKKGIVRGLEDSAAWFYIEMEDRPSCTVQNKFGEVEMGLDLLETAWKEKKELNIVECGLVF